MFLHYICILHFIIENLQFWGSGKAHALGTFMVPCICLLFLSKHLVSTIEQGGTTVVLLEIICSFRVGWLTFIH